LGVLKDGNLQHSSLPGFHPLIDLHCTNSLSHRIE
jgi:hypothetical protein